MFFDGNFWENVLIGYLSSIAAGITLALVGFGVYKTIKYVKNITQNNESGPNNINNIKNQFNFTIQDENTIKKIVKENYEK